MNANDVTRAEKVRAEDCQEVSSSVFKLKNENTLHELLPEKHHLDLQNVKEEKNYFQNSPEDDLNRFIQMDGSDVITGENVKAEACQEVSSSDSNLKSENTCRELFPEKHLLDPRHTVRQNVEEDNSGTQTHSAGILDKYPLVDHSLENACNVCHKLFNEKYELELHYAEHLVPKTYKKAKEAYRRNRPSKPKAKPLSSQQLTHVCEVCKKSFRKRCWLRLHFAVHSGEKPYACTICPAKFASSGRLKAHEQRHIYVQTHARPTAEEKRAEDCQKVSSSDSNSKSETSCPELLPDVKEQKGYSQNLSENKVNRYPLLVHSQKNVCNVCHKLFNEKCELELHYAEHSDPKTCKKDKELSKPNTNPLPSKQSLLVCEVCKKSFRKKCWLRLHCAVHTGDKPYSCSVCSAKFANAARLKTHEQRHSDVREHVCEFCQKSYRLKVDLNAHKKVHFRDKMYPCPICNKQFNRLSNLRQHCRVHTGEKMHVCDICDRRFSSKINLNTHYKKHDNEKLS